MTHKQIIITLDIVPSLPVVYVVLFTSHLLTSDIIFLPHLTNLIRLISCLSHSNHQQYLTSSSLLSSSIFVFHSTLKTYLFHKSFPPLVPYRTARNGLSGLLLISSARRFQFSVFAFVIFRSISWLCAVD